MARRYLLRDGTVIDERTWASKQADAKYVQVEQTTLASGRWVSTLWLGVDGSEALALFESVVFDVATKKPLHQEKYATEAEARAGHARLAAQWA